MLKNSTVVGIPCNRDYKFFKYWVEFLKPFHKASATECEVIAYFLYKKFELSKKVSDDKLLNKLLFNEDTKKELCEYLHIQSNYLRCMLVSLRKKGIIIDETINPKIEPKISGGEDDFKLIIHFRFENGNKT